MIPASFAYTSIGDGLVSESCIGFVCWACISLACLAYKFIFFFFLFFFFSDKSCTGWDIYGHLSRVPAMTMRIVHIRRRLYLVLGLV